MRFWLAILGALALVSTQARAGKNAGGAMIVHTNDAVVATTGFCDVNYDDPGDCVNAGTRSDRHGTAGEASIIWFLAYFCPDSSPGVTVCYFGDDHNLPPGWILPWGFCGPEGTLEVPDSGWPEAPATAGNSVAFGSPMTDLMFPFYCFSCFSHDADAYFGTGINPVGGYAGFVSDDNPGVLDESTSFGLVSWFDDYGYNPCDCGGSFAGACCFADGTCERLGQGDCEYSGGVYQGDGTVCDPNPCPQPGACCFEDGSCVNTLEADCTGNLWLSGEDCANDPCPPVAIEMTTWGTIKSQYR